MSKRPLVKILLPFILGITTAFFVTTVAVTPYLLLVNIFLLSTIPLLWSSCHATFLDLALLVVVFLSGLVAVGGGRKNGETGPIEPQSRLALLQVTGFCRRPSGNRFLVDGGLLYLEDSGELRACNRAVRIILDGGVDVPVPGDLIVGIGELSPPDSRKNPGGSSQEEYYEWKGLTGSFRSREGDWHFLRGKRGPGNCISFGVKWRRRIGAAIEDLYCREDASFLMGILLGSTEGIPRETKNAFSRAGIYHILAISGLHVGLIAGMLYILFSLSGISPMWSVMISAPVLFAYGLVTGMKPPVQRSIVMVTLVMTGVSLQRKIDLVNLLAGVAMLLLLLSPPMIRAPGFQMSFLATWGILELYPGLTERFPILSSGKHHPIFRRLLQVVGVTLCAQIPLVPLMASFFHRLALMAPFANLIALPLMGILFPLGSLSVGVKMILGGALARPLVWATSFLIDVLFRTAAFFSQPTLSSIYMAPFDLIEIISFYIILACSVQFLRGRISWEVLLIAFFIAGDSIAAYLLFTGHPPLRVTFLDVGQGNGTVIEFPTGEVMIFDGGPASGSWDAGRQVMAPYLAERGIREVDIMGFSHPQLDHIGGLPFIMDNFKVDALFGAAKPAPIEAYSEILGRALDEKLPFYLLGRGDSFRVGDVDVQVLHPTGEWLDDDPVPEDMNDASVVLKVSYGGLSFLMTGDIGTAVESELVAQVADELESDVLEVPHHGSLYSTSGSFIDAVKPEIAVVSVGRGNPFGHPAPALMKLLADDGIVTLRTDRLGAVIFVAEPHRLSVFDGSLDLLFRSRDGEKPGDE